jgi:hypothetical protein
MVFEETRNLGHINRRPQYDRSLSNRSVLLSRFLVLTRRTVIVRLAIAIYQTSVRNETRAFGQFSYCQISMHAAGDEAGAEQTLLAYRD